MRHRPILVFLVLTLFGQIGLGHWATAAHAAGPPVEPLARPLPLGSAVDAPPGTSCPGGFTCTGVQITCPSVPPQVATIAAEQPTIPVRGVLLYLAGPGASEWYSTGTGGAKADSLEYMRSIGFLVTQMRFDEPWTTSPSGVENGPVVQACQLATAIDAVYDRHFAPLGQARIPHVCGFCVTGHSGASSAIAYALTRYGAEAIIDRAVLTGGPTHSSLPFGCLDVPGYKYSINNRGHIDRSYGFIDSLDTAPCLVGDVSYEDVWERDSVVTSTGGGDYWYPNTSVTMVLGENETTTIENQTNIYKNKLLERGGFPTLTIVEDTGHMVINTTQGMDAVEHDFLGTT